MRGGRLGVRSRAGVARGDDTTPLDVFAGEGVGAIPVDREESGADDRVSTLSENLRACREPGGGAFAA